MKLSHLSLAVVSAIALAACGTSNTNPVDNGAGKNDTPKETPKPTVDKGNKQGLSSNGLQSIGLPVSVYDTDLDQTSTTGGHSYVRGENADFDGKVNPTLANNGSAISVDTLALPESLKNYFGARQDIPGVNNKYLANFFGKFNDTEASRSVQNENKLNIANVESLADATTKLVRLNKDAADWREIADGINFDDGIAATAWDGKNSKSDNAEYAHPGIHYGNQIIGLVAIDFQHTDKADLVRGEDDAQKTTTRILGHFYDGNDVTDNNVLNSYKYATVNSKTGAIYAVPQNLKYVQFGRVTGDASYESNADTDALDFSYAKNTLAPYARGWMNHNDSKSVSYYFYRGINASKPEEIAQVVKDAAAAPNGGNLQYVGTALTYGLNNLKGQNSADVPNALDPSTPNSVGIGNFVKATFHTASNTVDGYIYNVWVNNTGTKYEASTDNLISFDGNVRGNSVVGTATNLKNNTSGKLDASFFGANASELGGAINAIEDGYGKVTWGAVFGAQRGVAGGYNYFFSEGNGVGPKQ